MIWKITCESPLAEFAFTSSAFLQNLCGGTNTLTVTSNDGCVSLMNISINQPSALVITNNPSNESSIGACDGQIVATSSGGTSPYTYTINGGTAQGSNTFNNLCAGTYSICTIDANGCSICESVIIETNSLPETLAQ